MSKKAKLLQKAKKNPHKMRFDEFRTLLEQSGFILVRNEGTSHFLYRNSELKKTMNIQEGKNGLAKEYQVKQFLKMTKESEE